MARLLLWSVSFLLAACPGGEFTSNPKDTGSPSDTGDPGDTDDTDPDDTDPDDTDTDDTDDTDPGDTGTPSDTGLEDDDLGYACAISFPDLTSPVTPERSFFALPTSNGYVSATYAIELEDYPVQWTDGTEGEMDVSHRLVTFTDHVMRQPDPDAWTRDLLYDLYLGIRVDGEGTWLSDVAEDEAAYEPGTGIIHLVQTVDSVEVDTWIFAPFHGETDALVVIGQATNTGSEAAVDLYGLMNFHLGGEGTADGESVELVGDEGIAEVRGDDALLYRGIEAPTHYSAAPGGDADNPWQLLESGADLSDALVSGDDVAAGMQWSLGDGTLGSGESAWAGFVVLLDDESASVEDLESRADAFVAGKSPEELLEAEESFWADYHAVESPPSSLDEDELAVWEQSTAVLKMGQVREEQGYGQILASLPPGGWNMSWPRDAAYAIMGLVRSGHHDEARDALQFMIDGDAGYYADYLGIDDYLVSACRYYGDGTEESDGATCEDGTDAGPNVELDDFGLFLWAWGTYIDESGDEDFLDDTLDAVLEGVADPLVDLIDDNDLLVADSSIWERHWYDCFPNGRKQFTYSDIHAVNGLRLVADLSGDASYEEAADRIRSGLLDMSEGPVFEESFDGEACPVLASSPEETCSACGPYDASVIDAVNLGVIDADSSLARGTLRALMEHLAMGGHSPGFLRNDDGTGSDNPYPWYDDQEWVVIDLRVAAAMGRIGEAVDDDALLEQAEVLMKWVTAQANVNADLIGELLSDGVYSSDDDADYTHIGSDGGGEYQGSVPMCGFGPGAYILAMDVLR